MGGWNPWRELRRRGHIVFALHEIADIAGGALYARRGDRAAIVIDPRLSVRDRNAALAHELVHDERGGIADDIDAPAGWAAVVAKEEGIVDRIVAGRLVPVDELEDLIRARADIEPVTVLLVADEFEVSEAVAGEAIRMLADRDRAMR